MNSPARECCFHRIGKSRTGYYEVVRGGARAEVVGGNVNRTNERMDERETIEAVYELGGTKATYGHEDIMTPLPLAKI